MHPNRRDVMFVFAASAAVGGCATSSAPVADWQQFSAGDGTDIHYRRWVSAGAAPKAVLQIVHGAAEHASRYDRFAQAAVASGYAVYGTDHRGHGRTRLRSGRTGDGGPDAWNRMVETKSPSRSACAPRIPVSSSCCSATASARSWRRTTSSAAAICSMRWC